MARADRPALMHAATGGPPSTESARRAVEAVWRIESARIVGALVRYTRDFEFAEDVAQEAVAEALVTWARVGGRRPTGSVSYSSMRRWAGWLRHPLSSSTEQSPSPWRVGHNRHCLLWMIWLPPTACRGRTCSRVCAASCSPGSAGPSRRGRSWSSPPDYAATSGSDRCCCVRRLRWRDIRPPRPYRAAVMLRIPSSRRCLGVRSRCRPAVSR